MLNKAKECLANIIDPPLWDQAKWRGTGFLFSKYAPPILAVMYTEETPAKEIFTGLRARMTNVDEEDLLRISLIEGVNLDNNPHSYLVHIGPHYENILHHFGLTTQDTERAPVATVYRTNTMIPQTSVNLDTFKKEFARCGRFFLAPAIVKNNELKVFEDVKIEKDKILFRHKSSLDPDDVDARELKRRGY